MTGPTVKNMPPFHTVVVKIILCFLLVSFFEETNAQLCTGSLGDPVVHITFGHGSNPGPPLSASTTNYTYIANDCPNDGMYTVRNQTSNCFSNAWYNLTSDHTGDPEGYFMLVNASYAPSDFYLQKIDGLCPNTTYEFAAWIMNLIINPNAIKPNITFSIEKTDGTVLNSYNSGDIAPTSSPEWKQYGFYFTTPADVSTVVIRMKNNAPGGIGNDLALDDITFRPCGPKVIISNTGSISDTISLCEGAPDIQYFNGMISTGFNHPISQWQVSNDNGNTWKDIQGANTTSLTRLPTTPGNYQYRLTVSESVNSTILSCRIASNVITIIVHPKPLISFTANNPVCEGSDLQLTANIDYDTGTLNKVIWAGPNGSVTLDPSAITTGSQPYTAIYQQAFNKIVQTSGGEYYLFVQNSLGCSNKDSISIVVNKKPQINYQITGLSCERTNLSFTDASSAAVPISNWDWDFGDSQTAVTQNAVHVYQVSGTYNTRLKITDANGCKDSLNKVLTIHASPQADFLMPEICISDPVANFSNSTLISDGSGASIVYQWNFGDPAANINNPNTSNSKDPHHAYTTAGSYPVQLTATSNQGCISDTIKTFTVNGSKVTTDFRFGNSVICSADTVMVINRAGVNIGSIVKLEIYWDYNNNVALKTVDDNPQTGKTYPFHYIYSGNVSESHKIRVIAYSGISCFDIKDTTITIYRTPEVQFDVLNNVCENTPSFLITQASETSGLSGVAVFNGKGVSTSGLFNPAIAGSGTYSIKYTFTSDAGCPADAEQTIQVNPKPTVNAGPDRVIIKGGGINLQAQASGNNLSFNWSPPDYVDQPQVLTPRATPPSSQVFTLKATSADGCSNVDSVLITVVNGFYIPNAFTPNGDGLNDVWRLPYLDAYPHMQVRVFNRWGQMVYQSTGPDVKWDGNMNGQQLPSGVYAYVIDLRDGGGVYKGTVTIIR